MLPLSAHRLQNWRFETEPYDAAAMKRLQARRDGASGAKRFHVIAARFDGRQSVPAKPVGYPMPPPSMAIWAKLGIRRPEFRVCLLSCTMLIIVPRAFGNGNMRSLECTVPHLATPATWLAGVVLCHAQPYVRLRSRDNRKSAKPHSGFGCRDESDGSYPAIPTVV
jgi:hypothetical protein